jgi:hypothetical protein
MPAACPELPVFADLDLLADRAGSCASAVEQRAAPLKRDFWVKPSHPASDTLHMAGTFVGGISSPTQQRLVVITSNDRK